MFFSENNSTPFFSLADQEIDFKMETFDNTFSHCITCVHRLHIFKLNGLPKHHLVERPDEETVQELPMIDCHPCNHIVTEI